MPLALDYHKLFTSTDDVHLRFRANGEYVEYHQFGEGEKQVKMISTRTFPMPVDKVTATSIHFSNFLFDKLVKRSIKFSDIKLLP